MNKKRYCKYCGRELELGRCTCDEYILAQNKKDDSSKNAKGNLYVQCDSCKKTIDVDSVYCPYCGLPVQVDGNIVSLQKELRGENEKDVIEIYESEIKPKDKLLFPMSFVVTIAITTLLIGVLFGYTILPGIRTAIFNYNLRHAEESVESIEGEEVFAESEIIEGDVVGEETEEESRAMDEKNIEDEENDVSESEEETEEETDEADETVKETKESKGVVVKEDPNDSLKGENESILNNGGSEESIVKITGVEVGKTYDLYIKKALRMNVEVAKGADVCPIVYYIPVIEGADQTVVDNANIAFLNAFNIDFITQVKNYILTLEDFPQAVTFTNISQRTANSSKFRIIMEGRITPRNAITSKIKYTIIYDKKNNTVQVQKSS